MESYITLSDFMSIMMFLLAFATFIISFYDDNDKKR